MFLTLRLVVFGVFCSKDTLLILCGVAWVLEIFLYNCCLRDYSKVVNLNNIIYFLCNTVCTSGLRYNITYEIRGVKSVL